MYHFAIVALLSLAALKLTDFLCDNIPGLERLRSLLTFIASIGAVWILNYSLFDGFRIGIRNHAVGVWATGFIVVGLTVPWRAVFRYLTHDSATADETLGEHHPMLRRVS